MPSRFDSTRSPLSVCTFASKRFTRLIDRKLCRVPDRPMPPNGGKRSTVENVVSLVGTCTRRRSNWGWNEYEKIGWNTWRIDRIGPKPPCDVP